MSTWRRAGAGAGGRVVTGSVVVGALVLGVGAVAGASPANPSDADIQRGRATANARAHDVGVLTNRLAQAEAKLQDLQDDVEAKMENANKALVDLQAARDAAAQARDAAAAAAVEAAASARVVEQARSRVDDFAAGSYQQGSMIGSISAFFGAKNPEDVLAREQMLRAVGASALSGLDEVERAQAEQANEDSAARKAQQVAQDRAAAAEAAKQTADEARDAAVAAQRQQVAQVSRLEATRDEVARELAAARATVSGLEQQRAQYLRWLVAQQAHRGPAGWSVGVGGRGAQAVISRAMSQLGVPYAWGGGTAGGPSRGIRDGGVADDFGDFHKVGFDCSGLMIYAFAGAGISLPHYSGYQYTAGRHVPLSDIRPGDLLFWSGAAGIHHVALYLGAGMMIEAPYSGAAVRIAPVRYRGIMPYATRLV